MKFKYVLRVLLVWGVLILGITYLDGIALTTTKYGLIPSFVLLFIIFAAVELLLYPAMKILILPLRILTLGLASVALSVNLVYLIAFLVPFFTVSSLWQAVVVGGGMGVARVLTK